MKTLWITLVLVSLSLFSLSWAKEGKERGDGPCRKIKKACKDAGFIKGDHKKTGKGLFVDCMKPLMNGENVSGVSVDSQDLSACKERKEARKERKNKRGGHPERNNDKK